MVVQLPLPLDFFFFFFDCEFVVQVNAIVFYIHWSKGTSLLRLKMVAVLI